MKPSFRRVTATLLLSAFCLAPARARVLDGTLATVNGEAILQSEFDKNLEPILEQFTKSTPPADQTPERIADIKKRVLDQMIEDRILAQEAKKKAIHVSQLEVDDGVRKVRSRFGSEDEFQKEMDKEGLNNDGFRKHIQDQIATIKLIDQEVKAKTPPPAEADVKTLYDTLMDLINDKPLPAGHTPSELEELNALAKAMQRRFSEQACARHILIRVSAHASDAERDAALKKIKDVQAQLKGGADFTDLAKKYSEDPGSKDHGGDLGCFAHGDMVPPFDKAAFGLEVGQVSDIVTTDFGYHIIRLDGKKIARKISYDDVKDDLKDYLFQQAAAKRFESYIKDLRSKSEIKINSTSAS